MNKDEESAAEEMKLDVADGNNVVENNAVEETITAETKLKKVADSGGNWFAKVCTRGKW